MQTFGMDCTDTHAKQCNQSDLSKEKLVSSVLILASTHSNTFGQRLENNMNI